MKKQDLNAFITVHEVTKRNQGALRGIRLGVKDIILTEGIRTTAGSKILFENVPSENAAVVESLLAAGATMVGKTNTHEFACGATNTSSIAGPARNPFDPKKISGGSSGGSAVAVAAGLVDVALGTDTAGSVRTPSSLCGVIGFKPTTGLLPSSGVIPLSRTLDTVGVISKDLDLLKLTFELMVPRHRRVAGEKPPDRPRLGLFKFGDDEASEALKVALKTISSRYDVKEIDFPLLKEKGSQARRTITYVEAAKYHYRWITSRPEDYFPDVRSTLEWGLTVKATDYIQARTTMEEARSEYVRVTKDIDAVLSPTTRITAPSIADVTGNEARYRDDILGNTELFSLVGAPSITIPAAKSDGMPLGLMISGRIGQDHALISIAEKVMSVLR